MDQKLKRKWVRALRSGKYQQGQGALLRNNRFCCLGVLADIQGCTWKSGAPYKGGKDVGAKAQHYGLLSPAFCGIRRETQTYIAVMNDTGKTFEQIADHIEKRV